MPDLVKSFGYFHQQASKSFNILYQQVSVDMKTINTPPPKGVVGKIKQAIVDPHQRAPEYAISRLALDALVLVVTTLGVLSGSLLVFTFSAIVLTFIHDGIHLLINSENMENVLTHQGIKAALRTVANLRETIFSDKHPLHGIEKARVENTIMKKFWLPICIKIDEERINNAAREISRSLR